MTTNQIQAIPTRYAGCHFRSRLEARWAVFFDALGIRWEYEPEGFMGHREECYLPDFQLHNVMLEACLDEYGRADGVYAEVKPTDMALHNDALKLGACIDHGATPIGAAGLLILGPIPNPSYNTIPVHSALWWRKGVAHGRVMLLPRNQPGWEPWSLYPADVTVKYEDDNVSGECGIPLGSTTIAKECGPYFDDQGRRINLALVAARSARFEHGESGPT